MQPNFTITTPLHAVGFVMDDIVELTLDDLCRGCSAQPDSIIALVSEGLFDSISIQSHQAPEQWRFTGLHLHRAKVAMRLYRDLGVNFAGVALALQLLDEIQELKQKRL